MTELERAGIPDELRTRCEIYTRVMGYHRPTWTFNVGKHREYLDRRMFTEAQANRHAAPPGS